MTAKKKAAGARNTKRQESPVFKAHPKSSTPETIVKLRGLIARTQARMARKAVRRPVVAECSFCERPVLVMPDGWICAECGAQERRCGA